jgi:hypothetical protein
MYFHIAGYLFDLEVTSKAVPELALKLHAGLKATFRAFAYGSVSTEPIPQHDLFSLDSHIGRMACTADTYCHHIHIELFTPAQDRPFPVLLQDFEAEIVNQAVRETPLHFWVHGACLCRDSELIYLVAKSGTGKTTMSLGLTQYGYRLITDDIILYDMASQRYIPMPRSPKIEGDAIDYLGAAGFDLERDGGYLEPYVLLNDDYWQQEPVADPPARVYFLQRGPEFAPETAETDLSSALLKLLPQSNLVAIDPDLSMAASFFASTRFINFTLSSYLDDLRVIAEG